MRARRTVLGLSVGILVTASLTLTSAGPAAATFAGTNGRIVFADYVTNQVYAINPDGTGLVELTRAGGGWPAASPDGRHVAFTSDRSGAFACGS